MRYILATALALAVIPALHAQPKAPDEYLKLSFEAKGKLKLHIDPKAGKIGTCWLTLQHHLERGPRELRVQLPDKKKLHELAHKLDGQTVIVTGTIRIVEYIGGDIRPPTYWLVAESLKSAGKDKKRR